jgi:hypothetical protein
MFTGGSDLGQAGLAVLIFGIVMVSLYLVVRAGVRAGMQDAWRQMGAPPAPPEPPASPVPEPRVAEESESEPSDHHSAA